MADTKFESLINEYFIRRKKNVEFYNKEKSNFNFNKLHAFSTLVDNIINGINCEIQKYDCTFNNYIYNTFRFEQNGYELTQNMKDKIKMIKNMNIDAQNIIVKYMDSLEHVDLDKVDDNNKKHAIFYFTKRFIDVYFEEITPTKIKDIDKILFDLDIKTNMSSDFTIINSIITNSKTETFFEFLKLFLKYLDGKKDDDKVDKKKTTKKITKIAIKDEDDDKKETTKKVTIKRTVTLAQKKHVAGKQFNKCANKPKSKLYGLEDYDCPLWKRDDEHKGCFDQSGYEIDHIKEFSLTHDDNNENLQALCKSCHTVKTKKFNMTKKKVKTETK